MADYKDWLEHATRIDLNRGELELQATLVEYEVTGGNKADPHYRLVRERLHQVRMKIHLYGIGADNAKES